MIGLAGKSFYLIFSVDIPIVTMFLSASLELLVLWYRREVLSSQLFSGSDLLVPCGIPYPSLSSHLVCCLCLPA